MEESYKKRFSEAINRLRDIFNKGYSDRLVASVIFGSVANDRHSPESDIDLLIILDGKKANYDEFSYFYDRLEEEGLDNLKINPIFKDKKDLDLSLSFLWNTEFIILYDRDRIFEEFLHSLNEFRKQNLILKNGYIEINEVTGVK